LLKIDGSRGPVEQRLWILKKDGSAFRSRLTLHPLRSGGLFALLWDASEHDGERALAGLDAAGADASFRMK